MPRTYGASPAHPTAEYYEETQVGVREGLTKREHIASLALQGILADPNVVDIDDAAYTAVEAADALIAALNEDES